MSGSASVKPQEVRDELARILAFEGIVNSAMLGSFLRFVVEETLAGRGDRLKAYTIGVEALKREEDFDPNDSAIVRVQARRLRDVLSRYYAIPGNERSVRIELPVGSYEPRFVVVEARQPARKADRGGTRSEVREPIAVLTLVLLGVFAANMLWSSYKADERSETQRRMEAITAEAPAGVGLSDAEVLPQIYVRVQAEGPVPSWFDRYRYAERLAVFARPFFDSVILRSPETAAARSQLQPTYELNVSLHQGTGVTARRNVLEGVMRVIDVAHARTVNEEPVLLRESMAGPYEPGSRMTTPLDLSLVREVVRRGGIIHRDLAQWKALSAPLSCLLEALDKRSREDRAKHLRARECLERMIVEHPRLAQAFVLLGQIYQTEFAHGLNPLPGDPLERAEAAVRKALRLSPSSPVAHGTMHHLLLLRGDVEEALTIGRKAERLNPEDLLCAGVYGSLLVRIGRYRAALRRLAKVRWNGGEDDPWISFYSFLALNNLGMHNAADRFARKLSGDADPLHLAAIAIAAHRAGDTRVAGEAIEGLLEMEREFMIDPRAPLIRRGFSVEVAERLMSDLHAAGLPQTPM